MPSVSTPLATNSPDLSAFWMNGGSVTRRSACGLDCSFSTRDTTSPEPASTRLTAMPVSLVNLLELALVPVGEAVGAVDGQGLAVSDPEDPVPPHAAVMAVAIATAAIAAVRRICAVS